MNTLSKIQALNIMGNSETIYQVNDYPWGFRLKTTAKFFMEFNKKHGFRLVQVTTDPKTGRECKPKKSTYIDSGLAYLYKDENGYIKMGSYCFNMNLEEKIEAAKVICHLWDYYTRQEQSYLLNLFFAMIKVETKAMVIYSGFNEQNNISAKEVISIIDKGVKYLADCIVNHTPPHDFTLDMAKYEELKKRVPADYSPFKSTTYNINFASGKLERID